VKWFAWKFTWIVLLLGALGTLAVGVIKSSQTITLDDLDELCARPGARCGSQPDWYTESDREITTLDSLPMSLRPDTADEQYLVWLIAAAVLFAAAAVAALYQHRHRFRSNQANG